MTYEELTKEYKDKISAILEKNEVFFAFNNEQLKEEVEKFNISKDNKMARIGAGGYLPVKNLKSFQNENKEATKWLKDQKKKLREDKAELEKAILYELENHECFYTGDITDAYRLFPELDKKEVTKIYKKYANAYAN